MGAFVDFRRGNGDNFRRLPAPKNAALKCMITIQKLNRRSLDRLKARKAPFDDCDERTLALEETLLRSACASMQALIDERRSPAWRESHRTRETKGFDA